MNDRDPHPRRTSITIRVYETTGEPEGRELAAVHADYDRDVDIPAKFPTVWPPCACRHCAVAP